MNAGLCHENDQPTVRLTPIGGNVKARRIIVGLMAQDNQGFPQNS